MAAVAHRAFSRALARTEPGLLGLLGRESDEFLRSGGAQDGMSDAEIAGMISERDEARRAKNFRRSDEIRAGLLEKGVVLEDGPRGTTWRRA